jgi:cell division protein FtsB
MAERKSGSRLLTPKVSLPVGPRGGRAKRRGGTKTRSAAARSSASTKTTEATGAKPGAKSTAAAAKAGADGKAAASKKKPPAPNMQERMEGLQGWMAEIERKQGRMTYFGGAAALLALLASGAAVYLGVTTQSGKASKDDVDALKTQVDGLQQAVTKNTAATQKTLNQTVTGLQSTMQGLEQKEAQDAAKIANLQSQVSSGALSQPAPTPGTTVTPGKNKP